MGTKCKFGHDSNHLGYCIHGPACLCTCKHCVAVRTVTRASATLPACPNGHGTPDRQGVTLFCHRPLCGMECQCKCGKCQASNEAFLADIEPPLDTLCPERLKCMVHCREDCECLCETCVSRRIPAEEKRMASASTFGKCLDGRCDTCYSCNNRKKAKEIAAGIRCPSGHVTEVGHMATDARGYSTQCWCTCRYCRNARLPSFQCKGHFRPDGTHKGAPQLCQCKCHHCLQAKALAAGVAKARACPFGHDVHGGHGCNCGCCGFDTPAEIPTSHNSASKETQACQAQSEPENKCPDDVAFLPTPPVACLPSPTGSDTLTTHMTPVVVLAALASVASLHVPDVSQDKHMHASMAVMFCGLAYALLSAKVWIDGSALLGKFVVWAGSVCIALAALGDPLMSHVWMTAGIAWGGTVVAAEACGTMFLRGLSLNSATRTLIGLTSVGLASWHAGGMLAAPIGTGLLLAVTSLTLRSAMSGTTVTHTPMPSLLGRQAMLGACLAVPMIAFGGLAAVATEVLALVAFSLTGIWQATLLPSAVRKIGDDVHDAESDGTGYFLGTVAAAVTASMITMAYGADMPDPLIVCLLWVAAVALIEVLAICVTVSFRELSIGVMMTFLTSSLIALPIYYYGWHGIYQGTLAMATLSAVAGHLFALIIQPKRELLVQTVAQSESCGHSPPVAAMPILDTSPTCDLPPAPAAVPGLPSLPAMPSWPWWLSASASAACGLGGIAFTPHGVSERLVILSAVGAASITQILLHYRTAALATFGNTTTHDLSFMRSWSKVVVVGLLALGLAVRPMDRGYDHIDAFIILTLYCMISFGINLFLITAVFECNEPKDHQGGLLPIGITALAGLAASLFVGINVGIIATAGVLAVDAMTHLISSLENIQNYVTEATIGATAEGVPAGLQEPPRD